MRVRWSTRRSMLRGFALLLAGILLMPVVFTRAQAAPAPRSTITLAFQELVTSFDPPTDWAIVATWIHSNIGDCLVWRDRKTGRFVPWLAERWQRLSDTSWRFTLRKGVKFHNGEPFNAQAAKFTIERILADKKMIVYNQWLFVKDIKVVDDHTIEIATTTPEPAMLSKMAGTGCQVVPPGYMQQVGPQAFAQKPVGTGPFKFVEFRKDDRVVLEANPEYFQGKPAIDRVIIRAVPEASTRVAELLRGGVDLVVSIPSQDWQRVEGTQNLKLEKFLTTQTVLLVLRHTPGMVTADPRIRAAIDFAIDRKTLVKLAGSGAIPTRTRVTPPTLGWHPNLYNKDIYNPDRARQLVREAGYAGQPITFHSTTVWPMQKEVSEAIGAMLEAVGLKVNLQILDISTFREQIYYGAYAGRGNRELYMDALGNSFLDPWIAVLGFTCARAQRTDYCRADLDQLIGQAAQEMVAEKRKQLYYKIQEIVVEDRPYVFLYQMMDTVGMSRRLEWTPAPDGFVWLGGARFK
jgi:peptide/nickel transport system substrate-binding protein